MVLAQYYNFVRLGREGYTYIIGIMEKNARYLAEQLSAQGDFELIDPDAEQLPLVAFQLVEGKSYDEFDVAWQLSAERGWMVPAYTLPPNAEDVKVMRALVKETLSRAQIDHLASDIKEACATLEKKGGLMESERRRSRPAPATDVQAHTLVWGTQVGRGLAPGSLARSSSGGFGDRKHQCQPRGGGCDEDQVDQTSGGDRRAPRFFSRSESESPRRRRSSATTRTTP